MSRKAAAEDYIRTHWGDGGDLPDQHLRCADPAEVYFAVLGHLDSVTYETQKGRGSSELWEHTFDNPRPILCYSPRTKLLLIAGGIYTVSPRGIEK